jgi:hypothetical protein
VDSKDNCSANISSSSSLSDREGSAFNKLWNFLLILGREMQGVEGRGGVWQECEGYIEGGKIQRSPHWGAEGGKCG